MKEGRLNVKVDTGFVAYTILHTLEDQLTQKSKTTTFIIQYFAAPCTGIDSVRIYDIGNNLELTIKLI